MHFKTEYFHYLHWDWVIFLIYALEIGRYIPKLHTSIIHKSVGGKKHTLHASATYVFIRFE